MYHIFIHSSVDGRLGSFHVLAIVNSATVNTGVQEYFRSMFFSGYMPRSGIVGSYGGSGGKESACDTGHPGSVPGLDRSLEKGMAIHSSILAWRIPWTEEPGRLQSVGLQKVGHNSAIKAFTVTVVFNLENSAVATGLERVSFHYNSKERQCQIMFKLPHNCTHLTCLQIMLKILQARLQQYMNQELLDIQAGFRKGRGTRDQIANICWIIAKAREFQKNIYFCFIDYAKAFGCMDHPNCGKFLKRWEYQTTWPASCEICMQVKKQQLGPDMEQWTGFQIGKGIWQGCILSPCLFNFYAEYIMWNDRLDEA